jgi:hypothetical protein
MPFFPRSRRGGRGRRREDDGLHAVVFELESLEFVQASDDVGLLRVGGRWIAPASRALGDMVLTVHRDTEVHELAPLPDMNGAAPVASPAGEEWRGAFTMAVEVAQDPRSEFALAAGDDGEVALPRPGEWEALQEDEDLDEAEHAIEAEPGAGSPVVAELVAQLDEIARTDGGHDAPFVDSEPAEERGPDHDPEPTQLAELVELRAQLDAQHTLLAAVEGELEAERRRSQALEQELRTHVTVEGDLRNAIAMREAELASAVEQASQRARQAERLRDVAPPVAAGDQPERPRSAPADKEFLARLERARRASEAAAPTA